MPDVVLLSACEVGRSSLRCGEELIGMTAAWLHAGSRCVIASGRGLNDEVAHGVLVKVHARAGRWPDPCRRAGRRPAPSVRTDPRRR